MPNLTRPKTAFGAWLRDARECTGLTQMALGVCVGRSETVVGRWERGDAKPEQRLWDPLGEALGVSGRTVAAAVLGGEQFPQDCVLPRLVAPGRAVCDAGCPYWPRCRRDVHLGLPTCCDEVGEDDVFAAAQRGLLAALMERAECANS